MLSIAFNWAYRPRCVCGEHRVLNVWLVRKSSGSVMLWGSFVVMVWIHKSSWWERSNQLKSFSMWSVVKSSSKHVGVFCSFYHIRQKTAIGHVFPFLGQLKSRLLPLWFVKTIQLLAINNSFFSAQCCHPMDPSWMRTVNCINMITYCKDMNKEASEVWYVLIIYQSRTSHRLHVYCTVANTHTCVIRSHIYTTMCSSPLHKRSWPEANRHMLALAITHTILVLLLHNTLG